MAKKRVQKIRFAMNLSSSDVGFKKLHDEFAAIDDAAHEESAATTLKRDLMLRILHDYCNPKMVAAPARTDVVRQSVRHLPVSETQTQAATEMQMKEVRVVSMTMTEGTAEQTKSIDDIFNESMKSFVDFD
jgi:hypothetical protein